MPLFEFYGETCPHCIEMKPLVEKLEQELGVRIEQKEVWNNADNALEQGKYDDDLCGGVPFFYNTQTGKHICGSTDYETLKKWATGE